MKSLQVKGGVREARHISEAMTRLLSLKEAICEMCEISQIGNLEHLRKDGLKDFPSQSNHGGLPKYALDKFTQPLLRSDSLRPFND